MKYRTLQVSDFGVRRWKRKIDILRSETDLPTLVVRMYIFQSYEECGCDEIGRSLRRVEGLKGVCLRPGFAVPVWLVHRSRHRSVRHPLRGVHSPPSAGP